MKYGKIFAILIVNIMIISGMSAIAGAGFFSKFSSLNEVEKEGTMKLLKYSPSNKELYVIEVNNPVTSNLKIKGYYPINLDEFGEDFKKDGLKVLFTGVIHFPSIISEKGIDSWLKEQETLWHCPVCGEPFSWYKEKCSGCGRDLNQDKDYLNIDPS